MSAHPGRTPARPLHHSAHAQRSPSMRSSAPGSPCCCTTGFPSCRDQATCSGSEPSARHGRVTLSPISISRSPRGSGKCGAAAGESSGKGLGQGHATAPTGVSAHTLSHFPPANPKAPGTHSPHPAPCWQKHRPPRREPGTCTAPRPPPAPPAAAARRAGCPPGTPPPPARLPQNVPISTPRTPCVTSPGAGGGPGAGMGLAVCERPGPASPLCHAIWGGGTPETQHSRVTSSPTSALTPGVTARMAGGSVPRGEKRLQVIPTALLVP